MELTEWSTVGVKTIHLKGDLDAASAPELDQRLQSLIAEGQNRIIVEFGDVGYLSSFGIRALVAGAKAARAAGGDVYLSSMSGDVKDVLDMTGFGPLFKSFSNTDLALAEFVRSGR